MANETTKGSHRMFFGIVVVVATAIAVSGSLSVRQFLDPLHSISPPQAQRVFYVPFPYAVSKWSKGLNFYHTMQCVLSGITASDLDPEFAAQNPDKCQFAAATFAKSGGSREEIQSESDSAVLKGIADAFWPISPTYSYDNWLDSNRPAFGFRLDSNYTQWRRQANPNYTDSNRVCRPDVAYNLTQSMAWIRAFLLAKKQLMDTQRCKNNESSPIEILLVNRAKKRRLAGASNLSAQLSKEFKVQFVAELGHLPLAQQLQLFAEHNVVVIPHGAGEMNLLTAVSWSQRSQVPTSVIEICPPYAHCKCVGICPHFFKEHFRNVAFFGLGFEYDDVRCAQWCKTHSKGQKDSALRRQTKKADIPPIGLAPAITQIIRSELLPRVQKHCSGQTVDLTQTPIQIVSLGRAGRKEGT